MSIYPYFSVHVLPHFPVCPLNGVKLLKNKSFTPLNIYMHKKLIISFISTYAHVRLYLFLNTYKFVYVILRARGIHFPYVTVFDLAFRKNLVYYIRIRLFGISVYGISYVSHISARVFHISNTCARTSLRYITYRYVCVYAHII